ncbi:pyridoxamine 5'-phosphate oxidase family protein [candidate division WOR-3 bacterium]|nr:pyridoxamine 5'-phosphate oxidase family protein [candidate division WOR-3 bacterium]
MDELLKDGKYLCFLSTVDEDSRPHLRPLICIIFSGKIYFSTKDGSRKAKEIALNPCIELVIPHIESESLAYVCFSGDAFRIYEESVKNRIIDNSGYKLSDYLIIKEKDNILLYELLPISVERFDPIEKCVKNITRELFNKSKNFN